MLQLFQLKFSRCCRAVGSPVLATAVTSFAVACAPPSAVPGAPAACPEGQSQAATSVVVVVTAASSEIRPTLPLDAQAPLVEAGGRDDGCVLVVAPDGTQRAWSLTPRRPSGEIERGSRRETLRRLTLAAIEMQLGQLAATAPGLDTRGAIADAVEAHPAPTTLIVVSSGVSTVPPVDLRRIGWTADGATVGAFIRQAHWLPDLTGWSIRFVNLGEAAGDQPSLPDPTRHALEQFWLDLCRGAGALQCRASSRPVRRLPPVATNDVPPVAPPLAKELPDSTTILPADALFGLDSADLTSRADGELRHVVLRAQDQDLVLSITGHADASTGDPTHNLNLSRRRALAVRDRLIGLGLDPRRIVAVTGTGAEGFSAAQERRTPGLAEQHRNVEIAFARRPTAN